MAEIKVYYEPELDLLTIFWKAPRKTQICSEMEDGVILIKDSISGEPIGLELISFKPGDKRIDGISLQMGKVFDAA